VAVSFIGGGNRNILEFFMLGHTELLKDGDWQMRYLSYISGLSLIFS
jgi:hypothetical protein